MLPEGTCLDLEGKGSEKKACPEMDEVKKMQIAKKAHKANGTELVKGPTRERKKGVCSDVLCPPRSRLNGACDFRR